METNNNSQKQEIKVSYAHLIDSALTSPTNILVKGLMTKLAANDGSYIKFIEDGTECHTIEDFRIVLQDRNIDYEQD